MAEAEKKDAKKDAPKEGEGKDEAAAVAAPVAAGGPSKLLLALGALGLVVVSAGIPSYFLLNKKPPEKIEDLAADAADAESHDGHGGGGAHGAAVEEELHEGEEPLGAIFPFETFTVNLSGGRYLRAQVQFEFTTRDVPRRFYARLVPLRDAIIASMTAKTSADLDTVRGKETLKGDLKDLVNQHMGAEVIKRVYFSQFVIQ